MTKLQASPGSSDSKRVGCDDLDPQWPNAGGQPRGPVLCVTYPNCPCGEKDGITPRQIGGDSLTAPPMSDPNDKGSSDSKRVSDERLAQLIEYVDWTARTDKAVDEVQAALRELQQLRAEKPHV